MEEKVVDRMNQVISNLKHETNSAEREFLRQRLHEFGIMLCGSARVGKSTLVNALCGKKVAKTSASLNSCTKEVCKYSVEVQYKENEHPNAEAAIVSFFDTPGIENWSETNVMEYVNELMRNITPICLLYCASPGSLGNTNIIQKFCEVCKSHNIFFALVCTNKFAGSTDALNEILATFQDILTRVSGDQPQNNRKNGVDIWRVRGVGLVTSVNSETFKSHVGTAEPEGVLELAYAIMEELDEEKLKGWCVALLENRDFWTRVKHWTRGVVDGLPRILSVVKGALYLGGLISVLASMEDKDEDE